MCFVGGVLSFCQKNMLKQIINIQFLVKLEQYGTDVYSALENL